MDMEVKGVEGSPPTIAIKLAPPSVLRVWGEGGAQGGGEKPAHITIKLVTPGRELKGWRETYHQVGAPFSLKGRGKRRHVTRHGGGREMHLEILWASSEEKLLETSDGVL